MLNVGFWILDGRGFWVFPFAFHFQLSALGHESGGW
jgi:hypothetical protein